MKKPLVIFILSFSLGLLLISFIAYANQTSINNYYPSPSGNYTKVHLINKSGASLGCTPGSIFVDTNGYLDVCKSDGTFASYPGTCFTRYSSTGPASCPAGYQVESSTSPNFGSGGIFSWNCCFNGGGNETKAGCFAMYSNSPTQPYLCSDVAHGGDANAYDIGCDYISSLDMSAHGPIYKRNCCFNDSLGTSITAVSTCVCPNTCGASNCGTDACLHSCGTCPSPQTCTSATIPGTCVCLNTCGADNCGTDPCGHTCGSGTCPSPLTCSSASPGTPGSCICPNTCGTNNCGTDACGHTCGSGTCPSPQNCVSGTCTTPNTCIEPNGCSTDPYSNNCGSCTSPLVCSSTTPGIPGTCVAGDTCIEPNGCSTDPLGDSCGSCPPAGQPSLTTCTSGTPGVPGTCTCVPSPACPSSNGCSTDNCGTSCGTCSGTETCSSATPGVPGICTACGVCTATATQCGSNVAGTNTCGSCTIPTLTCSATCVGAACPTLQSCNQGNCEWTFNAAAVVDTSGFAANGNVFVNKNIVINTNNQSWEQCGLSAPMGPVSSVTPFNCDNSASTNIWWEAGDACPFVYNCASAACTGSECAGTPGTLPGYNLCGACNTASPITCTSPDVCDNPWGSPYCCTPIVTCPSCLDYTYSCAGTTCSQNCFGSCATSGDGTNTECCSSGEEPCPGTSFANCCDPSSEYCDGNGNCVPIPDD